MRQRTVLSLIGDRYLDTQHDQDYIRQIEAELSRRKVAGIKRFFLEYLAASSLWGNILWWEWEELNGKDFIFGWLTNLVIFLIVFALSSYFFSLKIGALSVVLCHLATIGLGFSLRAGTVLESKNP